MAYKALYRKFRPAFFRDMVGQEIIVRTLKAQIAQGRIAHAYLFTGPRGTGKTSVAKIFARSINCLSPIDGDACGECAVCRALSADDGLDILEMDAASNNGVDEIRELRDKIAFPPRAGRYKVYIIDEVHMLSIGAFNALLKTLEEPPAHAVFILATTDVQKLPATILSRCQRFNFENISVRDISNHLADILSQVGAEFEPAATELIARSAEGGMRDALSLADMCLSYCGDRVTYEDVVRILGTADREFLFACSDLIQAADAGALLQKAAELVAQGRDVGVFMRDLSAHLSDLLLAKLSPESISLQSYTQDMRARLAEQASGFDTDVLLSAIELLADAEAELKLHTRPRIVLETVLARICMPQTHGDDSALRRQIAQLEEQVRRLSAAVASGAALPKAEKTSAPAAKTQADKPKPAAKPAAPPAESELFQALLARVRKSSMPTYMVLKNALGAERQENAFVIFFAPENSAKQAFINAKAALLETELEGLCGEKLAVRCAEQAPPAAPAATENDSFRRTAIELFGEENINFTNSETTGGI